MKTALQILSKILVFCFLMATLTSCGQRNTDSTLNSSSVPQISTVASTSTEPSKMDIKLKDTITKLIIKGLDFYGMYRGDFSTKGDIYIIKDGTIKDIGKLTELTGGDGDYYYAKLSEYNNAYPAAKEYDLTGDYPFDLTGVNTLEKLKAYTETAFTQKFAKEYFYDKFLSGGHIPAVNDKDLFVEFKGEAYVALGFSGGNVGHLDLNTMVVESETEDILIVKMKEWDDPGYYYGTSSKPNAVKSIQFKKVNGEWRIDSYIL